MRTLLGVACVALVASLAAADEITVDKVLTAVSLGAPAENIIAQINNPANTVAPVSSADVARLKSANVPEGVVQALLAKAPTPTPTPTFVQPDEKRLENLVKLIKQGVSESLIAEHLRLKGESYNLTTNDLLYLKQNQVPESLIGVLLNAGGAAAPAAGVGAAAAAAGATAAAAAAPAKKPLTSEVEITGLVMKKATFLRKDRVGKLVFKGDEISWVDSDDPSQNLQLRASGITKAWMRCQPRPQSPFCYELGFEIFHGDSFKFQDSKLASGINDQVTAVRQLFKDHYPNVLINEQIDN
jgi:hypothetical protein